MTHAKLKLLCAGLVLMAAVGYLAVAGVKKGWVYYLEVDQLTSDAAYRSQRVRLMGRVADEGVQIRPARLTARFDLRGAEKRVPVDYRGVVPDNFEPGRDVVVEGKLGDDGVFHADVLMTKCASKYESAEHAERVEALE